MFRKKTKVAEPSTDFNLVWTPKIEKVPEVNEWHTVAYGFKIEVHKYTFECDWRIFCILDGMNLYASGRGSDPEKAQANAIYAAAKLHALGAVERYP
jgi:hypothetical protein